MNRNQKKLSWGVLLAALGLAAALLMLSVWLLGRVALNSPDQSLTPFVTIIHVETATPIGNQDLFSTQTPTPGAVRVNGIGVGDYVQISGTEGVGLRIRQEAGINGTPLFLGMESEVFKVKDGPKEMDGYNWWFIEAPYDSGRSGWAAAQFLAVVTSQEGSQP
jgi:hypothetical protein